MAPSLLLGVCSSSARSCPAAASSTCFWLLPPTSAPWSRVRLARMTNGPTEAGSAEEPSWISWSWLLGWDETTGATSETTSVGEGETEGEGAANEADEVEKGESEG